MNSPADLKPWIWLRAWNFFAVVVLGLGLHAYDVGATAVADALAPFGVPLCWSPAD